MVAKLIQYWNIQRGRPEEFNSFFMKDFVPKINETGLMKIVGAWQVASGEGPYFITEGVSRSLKEVENLIMGLGFLELHQQLLCLVDDYATKLLVPTGAVEPQPPDIEHGYKFTQHFNINAADYYEFITFQEHELLPRMSDFGIELIGEWNVAVGSTPYVIVEGRAEQLAAIGEMLESPEYQRMILKLLGMVTSYGCKVLTPTGQINK